VSVRTPTPPFIPEHAESLVISTIGRNLKKFSGHD
jgi:hypothetical protein